MEAADEKRNNKLLKKSGAVRNTAKNNAIGVVDSRDYKRAATIAPRRE